MGDFEVALPPCHGFVLDLGFCLISKWIILPLLTQQCCGTLLDVTSTTTIDCILLLRFCTGENCKVVGGAVRSLGSEGAHLSRFSWVKMRCLKIRGFYPAASSREVFRTLYTGERRFSRGPALSQSEKVREGWMTSSFTDKGSEITDQKLSSLRKCAAISRSDRQVTVQMMSVLIASSP